MGNAVGSPAVNALAVPSPSSSQPTPPPSQLSSQPKPVDTSSTPIVALPVMYMGLSMNMWIIIVIIIIVVLLGYYMSMEPAKQQVVIPPGVSPYIVQYR